MSKRDISNILKKFAKTKDVEICLLIENDGDIIESEGDIVFLRLETIALMGATIYGAAKTTNEQLEKEKTEEILIKDSNGYTIIKPVTDNMILFVRTKTRNNLKIIRKNMKIVKKLIEKYR